MSLASVLGAMTGQSKELEADNKSNIEEINIDLRWFASSKVNSKGLACVNDSVGGGIYNDWLL
jgi:hypothetical protein